MNGGGQAREQLRPARVVDLMCARFEQECRRRRLRLTAQRLAVYRALAADPGHPTAETVYAGLRRGMRGLSLATVYRILESLEHEGFVRRVSTTAGVGRFDARLSSHQHLVCRKCGRMADTELEALEQLSLPRRGPAGFVFERLDISIIGICAACRRQGVRRS